MEKYLNQKLQIIEVQTVRMDKQNVNSKEKCLKNKKQKSKLKRSF